MATVTFDRARLALASAPGTALVFGTSNRSDVRKTTGEVRQYAGGRRRAVSKVGSEQTVGVVARNLTLADAATLDSWRGQTVIFRDATGRKVYGVFWTTNVDDYKDRATQDVAFTLEDVTYSEAG